MRTVTKEGLGVITNLIQMFLATATAVRLRWQLPGQWGITLKGSACAESGGTAELRSSNMDLSDQRGPEWGRGLGLRQRFWNIHINTREGGGSHEC